MLIAGKVVAIALAALLANYLLNQLSTLRDFPGKTWLLVRLIAYLVVIAVAHEILAAEGVSDRLQDICRYAGVAAGVAVLYEGSGLWQQTRRLPAEEEDELAAAVLLKRLHDDVRLRIKGRLEYAVGEKAISVEWESQNSAVGRDEARQVEATLSWNRLLKFFSGGRGEVDIGENILQAFNHENIARKLLILGEPGSGKTTTLLKLAEALIAQFETTNQVPYIFELSAWRDDQQPILDWLTGQLKFDHGIDPKVSRRWIRDNQLLPLLDGLDELEMKRQKKCVAKVNDFATLPGQQVVVCCRSAEYAAGQVTLDKLNGALCLQPLTLKQIERYLRSLKRVDIWNALNHQPELAALLHQAEREQDGKKAETPFLQIPLFLQMLVVAYRDEQPITDKPSLFGAYVAHQLKLETRQQYRDRAKSRREEPEWAYETIGQEPKPEQTKRYLVWLAKQLNDNNIPNNFLIEQMQPSWLETKAQKWQYRLIFSLIVGLIVGLIFGLIFGLIGGLIVGLRTDFQTREIPNQGIIASMKNTLIVTVASYPASVSLLFFPNYLAGRDVVLQNSLVPGVFLALLYGFFGGGGGAALQHCILRFLLHRQGHISHNYAQFLKYTTERRLTQQIGGRFRFIHRELLDHFDPVDRSASKN